MAKWTETTIEGETVTLDGNEYKACDFRRCRLVYRGGEPPVLVQDNFAHCTWHFEDAAERTLEFLRGLYHSGAGGRDLIEKTFADIRRNPPGAGQG